MNYVDILLIIGFIMLFFGIFSIQKVTKETPIDLKKVSVATHSMIYGGTILFLIPLFLKLLSFI